MPESSLVGSAEQLACADRRGMDSWRGRWRSAGRTERDVPGLLESAVQPRHSGLLLRLALERRALELARRTAAQGGVSRSAEPRRSGTVSGWFDEPSA
jgi:hypothetical protein